jgi:hypothetical protein
MELPINLQRKDSIIVPVNKIHDLFEWRSNNQEIVRNFTPILEDVVVNVGGVYIHVEVSEDPEMSYKFTTYAGNEKQLIQHWNRYTMKGYAEHNKLPDTIAKSKDTFHDYVESTISVYCSLMAYMEHYREVVTKQDVTTKKTKDRKKKGGNKKKVTYLKRTVYTVSGEIQTGREANTSDREKRAYTIPSEPFKVHGHWRHYRNGKSVWIEGYTKNKQAGKEAEPKVYQY